MSKKIIGIDFGTTNSVVSIIEGKEVKVLKQPNGDKLLPSVVAFNNKTGEKIIGKQAESVELFEEWIVVKSIKSSLGKKKVINKRDGKILEIPKPNGQPYRPEEISSIILKELKKNAEDVIGEKVTEAVVTVPARFNDKERNAILTAGEIAGLKIKSIINEPTSALLEHGFKDNSKNKGNILVYDFGGGTFDVSLININDDIYKVLSTGGDNLLGGDDIDKVVYEYLMEKFQNEHDDAIEFFELENRMFEASIKAKESLSFQEEFQLTLPMIGMSKNGPINGMIKIDVDSFEKIVEPIIDKTIVITLEAIEKAKLSREKVDSVLLVGGTTRIPLIREKVSKALNMNVKLTLDPDESVSKGAAIHAARNFGSLDEVELLDVTPFDIGIELDGNKFDVIIENNSTIPLKVKRNYTNSRSANLIEIPILQGDSSKPIDELHEIGIIQLEVGNSSASELDVEVEFNMSSNGTLSVTAFDNVTNTRKTINLKSDTTMSKGQINYTSNLLSSESSKLR